MPNKEVKRHLVGIASMVFGGMTVLVLVFSMNAFSQAPAAPEKIKTAEFEIEKRKPPPKQRPKPQKQTKQVRTTNTPRAPMPELASGLSGVSFDLPGIASGDLGVLNEKLLGDTNKETTMTADVVDDPPRPRSRVQPPYPDKARQRGITGYVTLKLKVTPDGAVDSVRVVEASPRGIFEEAAIASIKQWQFDPATYHGNPVGTWVSQTLRFELN